MTNLERRQVPFAMSLSLNRIAFRIKADEETHLKRALDRPTPFTQRGVAVRKSTKRNLTAEVFVKPIQAQYLRLQQTGGVRRPAGRRLVIPAKGQKNRYGNLPRGKVRRLLSRPDVFTGRVNGVEGIWQRRKRKGPKLLVLFARQERHTKRLDYQGVALTSFNRWSGAIVRSAFRQAQRTSR